MAHFRKRLNPFVSSFLLSTCIFTPKVTISMNLLQSPYEKSLHNSLSQSPFSDLAFERNTENEQKSRKWWLFFKWHSKQNAHDGNRCIYCIVNFDNIRCTYAAQAGATDVNLNFDCNLLLWVCESYISIGPWGSWTWLATQNGCMLDRRPFVARLCIGQTFPQYIISRLKNS